MSKKITSTSVSDAPKPAVSDEQIAAWKQKHGDVFELSGGGKIVFIKKPTREIVSLAQTMAQKSKAGFAFVEVILKNCYLGGDEIDLQNIGEMVGFSEHIDAIMEVQKFELKKR